MNDHEHAQRGRQALELLDNTIFVEAFAAVRDGFVALMVDQKKDDATTLKAKLAIGLLADVKTYIEMVAKNGRIAAETINMEKAREEAEAKRKWWKVAS